MHSSAVFILNRVWNSDGSGMEKVGFGRVQIYLNFEKSGSGISGIGKVGFGRVWKVEFGYCIQYFL